MIQSSHFVGHSGPQSPSPSLPLSLSPQVPKSLRRPIASSSHRPLALSLLTIIFLILTTTIPVHTQSVPEHISNKPVYDFLDELANEQIISVTSVVRPWSRSYIAEKLMEARQNDGLNYRQRRELLMYLEDYALEVGKAPMGDLELLPGQDKASWTLWPPKISYRDSVFGIQLTPIYGIRNIHNENGTLRQFHGGLGAHAYVGDNWAFWASLRDHHHKGGVLGRPSYLTREQGAAYKGGGDFSEMRAGVSYAWNWGMVALQKDHEMWGDNYHGANIFSGRTPSFAMIKLKVNPVSWLQLDFHHGWLVSEVIDSARTWITEQELTRGVYLDKYVSTNMLTVTPFRGLDISAGNAMIYSDVNVQPAYLIPLMFYKSIDHTLSRGVLNQNSMMFFNVSSRQIKHLHLYGSWFVDEFSINRIGDEERRNFTSTKGGFRLSNWPVPNVSLTTEVTFTYPQTFKHKNEATTFETNRVNLGHYLRGNAREIYMALNIKPFPRFSLDISYLNAEKGNLRTYEYGDISVDSHPYMQDIIWSNETLSFSSRYMFHNNFSVFAELHLMYIQSDDVEDYSAEEYLNMFTPSIYHGQSTTFSLGFQMGF